MVLVDGNDVVTAEQEAALAALRGSLERRAAAEAAELPLAADVASSPSLSARRFKPRRRAA